MSSEVRAGPVPVRSLAALGTDLVDAGRPDAAFQAFAEAFQAAPIRPLWPVELRTALWDLVALLADGTVDAGVRFAVHTGLRESLEDLRFEDSGDRVLCQVAIGLTTLSTMDPARGLAAADALTEIDEPEPALEAVVLLASALIRQRLGRRAPELREVKQKMLRLWAGPRGWRRLLVRTMLATAVEDHREGRAPALNSAGEAVGHARHLHGEFRTVLLPEALHVLSVVPGDLGRHREATVAEIRAIEAGHAFDPIRVRR
ncbi:hypothetical protein [Amycolatopsis sp.]|uniref:hypothetical protein n=1 Tax=Amycolatopsis sp. TaxID=37632 RepID=UPI002B5383C3|nr:hypothetical protein [Amycolatopsis sp.]HVV12530.1 hypothetical protein [Amycolatopsis sp.]